MGQKRIHEIPEWVFEFHGHRCPMMPLGYLAGKYALKLLGIEKEKDTNTYVFSETGDGHHQGCFDDGVQAATGCTYGKGNYKRLQYGKLAIIVYKPDKGAVRIRPKPEMLNEISKFEFFKYRKSEIPASQIPREVSDEVINYILSKDFEELFYYEFLKDFTYSPPKKTMTRIICDGCGEPTYENYIKIFNGKKLCPRCYEVK
ncbi:FmdE family protein [Pyrobaculum sp. 3827-6]|uniref:FmdE family protein n=1 Tax=Pyrobaculum sp. 3827-6 TaxID=2983604 RepID=UPI0021DB2441|nr:FmdE family protein [Pyrobaculum sp. 3827-6]MCU7788879.1 FmdE family protein [Pyrobaculum sp. 3827-6]